MYVLFFCVTLNYITKHEEGPDTNLTSGLIMFPINAYIL